MANNLYTYAPWQYYAYCDFVVSDGKIFFINCRNLPVSLDIQEGTAKNVSGIKKYSEVLKLDTIEKMVHANGKIYGFESKGENMVIYDPEKNCCQCKELDFHQKDWGNALSITLYGDDIYVFPKYKDFILKIDTKTDQAIKIDNPAYARMDKNVSAGVNDGYVYFFLRDSNKVTEYDLCADRCREYNLSHKLGNLVRVQYFDGLFFLLSRDGGLWAWDVKGNILETLVSPFIKEENSHYFSMCTATRKNIWLLPDIGEDIYIYCRESRKLEKYDGYPEGFTYFITENWGKYITNHEYGGTYYHDMHAANCILCIDKNSGEEKWIKPSIPGRMEECQYYIENGCQVILQEAELPLEKFIETVSRT